MDPIQTREEAIKVGQMLVDQNRDDLASLKDCSLEEVLKILRRNAYPAVRAAAIERLVTGGARRVTRHAFVNHHNNASITRSDTGIPARPADLQDWYRSNDSFLFDTFGNGETHVEIWFILPEEQ